jgi:hypothetical protein
MPKFPLTHDAFKPVSSQRVENGWLYDFANLMVGNAHFTIKSTSSGTVNVYYGEHRQEALRTADYTCGWYHLPVDRIPFEAGSNQIRTPGRRAFRFLMIRTDSSHEPIEIDAVFAVSGHYKVPQGGSFACADKDLNHAWELAERTTRLCMQQYYEDGVKRDGLLWIGDYRVQFLCNALLFGDRALARHSLQLIARSARPDGILPACAVVGGAHQHDHNIDYMPNVLGKHSLDTLVILNYVTDYVCAVREYLNFHDDPALLAELWPVITRQIQFITSMTAGQPILPEYVHHVDTHRGTWTSRGVLAFQCLEALRHGLILASAMDDAHQVAGITATVASHEQWIRDTFPIQATPLLRNEPESELSGTHVHVHALLAGYLNPDQFHAAWAAAHQRPETFAAKIGMAQFYHLLALFSAGMPDTALHRIREIALYLRNHDAKTCWEIIDTSHADGGGFTSDTVARSYCHGWSAAPTYLFPRYLLGINPLKADWTEMAIEPVDSALAWIEGSVPTPHGRVTVHYRNSKSGLKREISKPSAIKIHSVAP